MNPRLSLLTLCRDEIAPRFDMAAEVLIAALDTADDAGAPKDRHLVLAHVSSEELCDVITRADVSVVVCGGIEEDYFHYLRWKRIEVICDVMGQCSRVLEKLRTGTLRSGDRLYGKEAE